MAIAVAAIGTISLIPDAVAQETTPVVQEDASTAPTVSPGQAELDDAIVKRISAETEKELESVAALLESSLKKGLDAENESFAKKMLGSVLLQQAQGLAGTMMQAGGRRRMDIRDESIRLLKEATKYDPELVDGYLLIARLNLLPGGDRSEILDATSRAIELLADNPAEQSSALVLRALTQEDDQLKLVDLDAAVAADATNMDARQTRAALKLQLGDVEGAMADLEAVLMEDPTNQAVAGAAVQKLVELERLEEAMSLITKMLATTPSEGMYRMRAILFRADNKLDEAMADLNKAIAMAPKDPMTLMQRAALSLDRDDVKSAKADYAAALEIEPRIEGIDEAIELTLQIAIAENRMADAINAAQLLSERAPDDLFRRLRLASLYTMDERPRKAIDVLTSILADDPRNVPVLRSRGDALLSVGDHTAAIDDYEMAVESMGKIEADNASLQEKSEASGIYNNLSWVLATSPNDSIRDGKRSLELAEMASELTDYKAPHILSTLAAAYAETGDFENAKKWSAKAVELSVEDDKVRAENGLPSQMNQLKEELESYQKGQPWREKQETEENDVPILSPEDLIDT